MSRDDIYHILSSINHNPHYLLRYIKFILNCKIINENLNELEYTERHHICPKSKEFWPEYKSFKLHPWNLAKLTPRQHYIAHWMLAKAYGRSMWFAFHMMHMKTDNHERTYAINSSNYAIIKKKLSICQRERIQKEGHHLKGKSLSDEHKQKISDLSKGENNHFYGKKHSQETKELISKKNSGRLSGENNPMYGKKGDLCPSYGIIRSEETRNKMRQKRKENYKEVTCPHCKTKGEERAMNMWHFDNCGKTDKNKGSNNGKAKIINIYNAFGFLIFKCHGNFTKICKENNIPITPMANSYKNNGKPIMLSSLSIKRAIKKQTTQYIGWFALEEH
jgi:ribosomal protein L37AE/L43A